MSLSDNCTGIQHAMEAVAWGDEVGVDEMKGPLCSLSPRLIGSGPPTY